MSRLVRHTSAPSTAAMVMSAPLTTMMASARHCLGPGLGRDFHRVGVEELGRPFDRRQAVRQLGHLAGVLVVPL
jgi:hypothetical protein